MRHISVLAATMISAVTVVVAISPSVVYGGPSDPFSERLPSCPAMTAVKVDGTLATHHYSFVLLCTPDPDLKVEAAYDSDSGRADEKLAGTGWTIRSRWNCTDDPWGPSGGTACGAPKTQIKGDAGGYGRVSVNQPFSAYYLSDQERHVLAAQLNNALNAAAPKPVAPSVKNDRLVGKVKGTDHSDVLTLASVEDLTIVRIDGPTTLAAGASGTYSFIIGNVGNLGGPVEVNILFAGALDETGQVSADSGLSCDSAPGTGKVHTNLHCTGGQLDPQRSATVTVQAVGMSPGAGSVIASANNSRAVDERDYSNNLGRRDVAVN